MSVSVETLIGSLPPYRDEWITIHPRQEVKHIMQEVCEAHDEFAPYYDNIALYFDADSTREICDKLYSFCKKNIRYKEESEENQTTALPTGILVRGFGDCKHYSGFTAGVLDALNRAGKKIKWCYCFASYKPLIKTPHHVFIKVFDDTEEIWIDPTPGADNAQPVWMTDKKMKAMPLHRNISGMNDSIDDDNYFLVDEAGEITERSRPYWQLMGIEATRGADGQHGTNPYFTGRFLGLQHYQEDPFSIEGTDWNITSDDLQAKSGIDWDPAFVKWIYENSMKFWNFFYPQGVQPGYTPAVPLPEWYPKPVITEDYRLTFDRDYQVDDYMNNEIQGLTAWIQALINEYDDKPFPIKTRDVKLFSQNNTGMPGNPAANLFNEHRGAGFVKDVLKGLENVVNKVKKGVFKIVGSVPRNAFLGLVGINAFNFAGNMWEKIEAGEWDKMAKKWEALGGNPDKLRGTIEDGKDKKAILGEVDNVIGEATTASALLAAAAPIIAAMLAFIKDKDGKIKDVLAATKNFFAAKYPEVDFTPFGFLDKDTGKEIEWEVDDKDNENKGGGDDRLPGPRGGGNFFDDIVNKIKDNPIPFVALGVGGYLLLTKKRKVSGLGSVLPWLLVGYAAWELFLKNKGGSGMQVDQMRNDLIAWNAQDKYWATVMNKMEAGEVADVYNFIFNYYKKGLKPEKGTALHNAISAIAEKYNIFT